MPIVYNIYPNFFTRTSFNLLCTFSLFSSAAGSDIHYINFNTHATTTVYVAVNLCITGTPIWPYHFIHTVIVGAVYISFTGIYYALGGTNQHGDPYIYELLDWNNPASAGLYAFLFGIPQVIGLWFLLYGLYHLRLVIYRATMGVVVGESDIKVNDSEAEADNGVPNPAYEKETNDYRENP